MNFGFASSTFGLGAFVFLSTLLPFKLQTSAQGIFISAWEKCQW